MYRTRIRKIEILGSRTGKAVVRYQAERTFNNIDDAISFARKLEQK